MRYQTVGLLPNALASRRRAGGASRPGSSTTWGWSPRRILQRLIVDDGTLRTRDTNANILRGVTRLSLLDLAREAGLKVEGGRSRRPRLAAKEAFVTGAGALVLPVVAVDGKPVGNGSPGPLATRLRRLYIERAKASAI